MILQFLFFSKKRKYINFGRTTFIMPARSRRPSVKLPNLIEHLKGGSLTKAAEPANMPKQFDKGRIRQKITAALRVDSSRNKEAALGGLQIVEVLFELNGHASRDQLYKRVDHIGIIASREQFMHALSYLERLNIIDAYQGKGVSIRTNHELKRTDYLLPVSGTNRMIRVAEEDLTSGRVKLTQDGHIARYRRNSEKRRTTKQPFKEAREEFISFHAIDFIGNRVNKKGKFTIKFVKMASVYKAMPDSVLRNVKTTPVKDKTRTIKRRIPTIEVVAKEISNKAKVSYPLAFLFSGWAMYHNFPELRTPKKPTTKNTTQKK